MKDIYRNECIQLGTTQVMRKEIHVTDEIQVQIQIQIQVHIQIQMQVQIQIPERYNNHSYNIHWAFQVQI